MIRQASNRNIFVVMTLVAALATGPVAYAQETKEDELGWKNLADLSWVVTSGNSETSTLGFKNKSVRRWLRSTWEINAGGIKVRNTIEDKFAVGTDTDFNIGETTETTAENYFLNNSRQAWCTWKVRFGESDRWQYPQFVGLPTMR